MEFTYLKESEITVKNLIMKKIDAYHMILLNMTSSINKDEVVMKVTFENLAQTKRPIEKIVNIVSMEPGVLSVDWKMEEHIIDLDDDDDRC